MIKKSKFNIGQLVKHKILNFIAVIIDIDPIYIHSLNNNKYKILNIKNKKSKNNPWYHIITQDNNGSHIYIYISESQLSWFLIYKKFYKHSLYKISNYIKKQFNIYKLKN